MGNKVLFSVLCINEYAYKSAGIKSYYVLCVFVGTRDVSQLPHLQQVTNNFMSRSWMPLWAISATQISIKMANIKIKELFKGLQRGLCGLSTEINAANTKCHWMCLNSFVTVSTIVFPLFILRTRVDWFPFVNLFWILFWWIKDSSNCIILWTESL